MRVDIKVPDEHLGAVIGDLNARRGIVLAMQATTGGHEVSARVPLANLFGYVGRLRSLTRGRGSFTMAADGHGRVPKHEAEPLLRNGSA